MTWLRDAWTVTRNPFGCPFGTLTLRNVRPGSGAPQHRSRASVAATCAACVKSYCAPRRLQRHGDARHAEQRAFERARHRPRIRHIVAQVVALVDARDDEIRQPLEDLGDAMFTQSVGVPSTP